MTIKKAEWTAEKIKKFWDYESQFPDNYFTNQVGEKVVVALQEYINNKNKILDYGCGMGFLEAPLLKHGYSVAAMDFSRTSVEKVRVQYANEEKFIGAYYFEDLMKTGMKFDAIMVLEVLEHLNDFYLDLTMSNLKSLLESKTGIVVFTTPNDEILSKSNIYCPFCDSVFHRWQHVRSWNQKTLKSFLLSHGFDTIAIYDTNFSQVVIVKKTWQQYVKNIYHFLYKKEPKLYKKPHLVCIARRLEDN